MQRITLVICMFIALILAVDMDASEVDPDISIIDCVHESGGVFYHGTLSLIRGKARVTWTYSENVASKKTFDIAMTEEDFRGIWDSLNDIEDFKKNIVTDPNQKMDFRTSYVVGIIFDFEGKKGKRSYLIPANSISGNFHEWLKRIGYPAKRLPGSVATAHND